MRNFKLDAKTYVKHLKTKSIKTKKLIDECESYGAVEDLQNRVMAVLRKWKGVGKKSDYRSKGEVDKALAELDQFYHYLCLSGARFKQLAKNLEEIL